MQTIEKIISDAVKSAGVSAPDGLPIVRSKFGLGHYATSVALSLKDQTKLSAKDLAQKIADHLKDRPELAKVEVAGPGFINLTMSESWFNHQLELDHATSPAPILQDKTYIIEYSSPNIAKPMHVGHLRTTILGQTLVNLYRKTGATVVAWNHLGDWGTQFGKLIVAWQKWGDEKALVSQPIEELLRVYVKFHQEAKDHPELEDKARAQFKALQSGDKSAKELWQRFSDVSQLEFERMYQLLNVRFDIIKGESAYNASVHQLVSDALEKSVAKESEGAIIIPLDDRNLPPFLIQKSDGATLYATADLVSIAERSREVKPDEIIYVVGNEQVLHFQQLFAAAEKLYEAGVYGRDFALPKLTHVSYGFFRLTSGKMSTRQGEVIRLDEVINMAIDSCDKMLAEKNPDLTSDERQLLAKTIGVAAVKYTDLQHDRHTDVVFDWDKMFALDGNSIVYLFYAYARCNSILRESKNVESDSKPQPKDWTESEKRLMLTILDSSNAWQKSSHHNDPHHLIDHTYQVATDFSSFYNNDQILKAPPVLRERRLKLVKIVQEQLERLFEVLGVEAPDRL